MKSPKIQRTLDRSFERLLAQRDKSYIEWLTAERILKRAVEVEAIAHDNLVEAVAQLHAYEQKVRYERRQQHSQARFNKVA